MTEFNPADPLLVEKLQNTLLADIDDASVEIYDDGHRTHLGFSIIGEECPRKLWYAFRHAKHQDFGTATRSHGQTLRLFNHGTLTETPLIKVLEKAGCIFDERPVDKNGFPTQHRTKEYANGHAGGSMDEIGWLHPKFKFNHKILFEFKTSNTTEFRKLKKEGVKIHRYTHWCQMCAYGYDKGIQYALYVVVNKDTDEIYIEFLTLNLDLGRDMTIKAEHIVAAKEAPLKIANSGASWKCTKPKCPFINICHYDEALDKSCRSCKHGTAGAEGKWTCDAANNAVIPDEVVPVGCECYVEIQ